MEQKLKIAVFIDFDNIEIGVKSTLHREFDVAAVLDALKERGEIVTKFAYANWGRQESATRALSEHAVQMVQRDPSPRGDKNGADINLALDALEMAFTHDHINAFAIVSGDSDFIALVNKLKQYDKRIFVVGGRAFTSTILQKNCHEFVAYESIIDDRPRSSGRHRQPQQQQQQPQPQQQEPPAPVERTESGEPAAHAEGQPQEPQQERPPHQDRHQDRQHQQRQPHKRVALDLNLAMPLVERALGVLERREVRPQLGLLKSTMLQLDSTFNEKAYGAGSFTDFVEKLQKADFVEVSGGEGRYMIRLKGGGAAPEKQVGAKPEEAIPMLRDVLETHRLDVDNGSTEEDLAEWVREEQPNLDWRKFGFQEFSELLNYAQDKGLVRIQADEEHGLTIYLGAEFHPPAPPPEPEQPAAVEQEEPEDEPQPLVPGQPTATGEVPPPLPEPKTPRRPRAPRKRADVGVGVSPKKRTPRPKKKSPSA
ncbi:MAG TPA: NYN domain-containing protein [Bryobacteraceae bacterium]|nr:NYN domain-containing protein [Bryobacteraceae bacterium]